MPFVHKNCSKLPHSCSEVNFHNNNMPIKVSIPPTMTKLCKSSSQALKLENMYFVQGKRKIYSYIPYLRASLHLHFLRKITIIAKTKWNYKFHMNSFCFFKQRFSTKFLLYSKSQPKFQTDQIFQQVKDTYDRDFAPKIEFNKTAKPSHRNTQNLNFQHIVLYSSFSCQKPEICQSIDEHERKT